MIATKNACIQNETCQLPPLTNSDAGPAPEKDDPNNECRRSQDNYEKCRHGYGWP